MISKISELALLEAKTQIGQTEKPLGSNWGHPVQDYLATVGINFPASWCMSFIYWCFGHAALQLAIDNPLFKTGGVLAQLHNRYGNKVQVLSVADIEPGDIFIMDFGKGEGHTGIVESITGTIINTIEGNTNDNGSREGIEVCRRQRAYPEKLIVAFLRF